MLDAQIMALATEVITRLDRVIILLEKAQETFEQIAEEMEEMEDEE